MVRGADVSPLRAAAPDRASSASSPTGPHRCSSGATLPSSRASAIRAASTSDRPRTALRPATANAPPASSGSGAPRRLRALGSPRRTRHPSSRRDAVRRRRGRTRVGAARLPGRLLRVPPRAAGCLVARRLAPRPARLGRATLVGGQSVVVGEGVRREARGLDRDRGSALAFQGRGIGTEMRAAVLELAFRGLGAVAATSRRGSRGTARRARVSEKLGYRAVGVSEISPRGRRSSHHDVRLERERWRSPVPVEIAGLEAARALFGAELSRASAAQPRATDAASSTGANRSPCRATRSRTSSNVNAAGIEAGAAPRPSESGVETGAPAPRAHRVDGRRRLPRRRSGSRRRARRGACASSTPS